MVNCFLCINGLHLNDDLGGDVSLTLTTQRKYPEEHVTPQRARKVTNSTYDCFTNHLQFF